MSGRRATLDYASRGAASPPAGQLELTPERHWPIFLVLILLLAAGVRIAHIATKPLWLDELWTLELSTGRGTVHLNLPLDQLIEPPPATTQLEGAPPPWRVWTGMKDATHPPLYFLALRLWREVFGGGDVSGRALSLITSLAAVAILFDIGRRTHGPGVGLLAGLLLALAQPQIEYAVETRNYCFLQAAALGTIWTVVRIEKDGVTWARLIGLAVLALTTALSHYFAAGPLLALGAYVLWRIRGAARWQMLGALAIAGTAFLLAWAPFMPEQSARFTVDDMTTDFLLQRSLDWRVRVFNTLTRFWSLPVRHFMAPPENLVFITAGVGMAAVVTMMLTVFLTGRGGNIAVWICWAVGAIGLMLAMDVARATDHLAYVRYTFLAGPAIYMVSAVFVITSGRILRGVGMAVLLSLCGLGYLNVHSERYANWPGMAELVLKHTKPGDALVFVAPGWRMDKVGYMYMGISHYGRLEERSILIMQHALTQQRYAELRQKSVWLINGSPGAPSHMLLPGSRAEMIKGDNLPAELWKITWQ